MKRTLIVASVVLTLAPSLPAQTRADFSGSWTLDAAHSIGLPKTQPQQVRLLIKQTPKDLVMDRTAAEKTTTTRYLLDGTETMRTNSEGTVVKARSRWQGGALVTESAETRSMFGLTVVVLATETCRMLADDTLVIDTTMKGGGKEAHRRMAFTRARH